MESKVTYMTLKTHRLGNLHQNLEAHDIASERTYYRNVAREVAAQ